MVAGSIVTQVGKQYVSNVTPLGKEYVIYPNERYETVQLNETDGGLNFHKINPYMRNINGV